MLAYPKKPMSLISLMCTNEGCGEYIFAHLTLASFACVSGL